MALKILATYRKHFPKTIVYDGGKDEAWRYGFGARNHPISGLKFWSRYPNPPGVYGQEIYEYWRSWRWLVIFKDIPFFGIKARAELRSHAIETICAEVFYEIPLEIYEDPEVRSMRGYDWLDHMTEEQILAGMRKYYPWARKWVKRHHDGLLKFKLFIDDLNKEA